MHYPLTTLSRHLVYNSIKLISLRYGPWNSCFFNIIRFTTRNIRNVDSLTNLQKIRLLGLDIKYLSYGINTNFDYFFYHLVSRQIIIGACEEFTAREPIKQPDCIKCFEFLDDQTSCVQAGSPCIYANFVGVCVYSP